MKLNIGCGRNIMPGWINIDSVPLDGVDLVCNLEDATLPYADNSVDEILMSHVIEHIENLLPLMQELYRVARKNGRLVVRCPHGASDDAYEDPTHCRRMFTGSFGYFGQPYYWRADYNYRGDWDCASIDLIMPDTSSNIDKERNVVQEMVATLYANKPMREPKRSLQSRPLIHRQKV